MSKRLIATIVTVAVIIIALLLICPQVFKDMAFLPQETKDSLAESITSEVPIEWQ